MRHYVATVVAEDGSVLWRRPARTYLEACDAARDRVLYGKRIERRVIRHHGFTLTKHNISPAGGAVSVRQCNADHQWHECPERVG